MAHGMYGGYQSPYSSSSSSVTQGPSPAAQYEHLLKTVFPTTQPTLLRDLHLRLRSSPAAIYAVVSSFKQPSKSRGSDYSCSLVIVDPSLPSPTTLLIFREEITQFPTVCQEGDILKLENCRLQKFNEKIQCLIPKTSPCYVIPTTNIKSEHVSTIDYTFSPQDSRIAQFLSDWWVSRPPSTTVIQQPKKRREIVKISEIRESLFFDLYALVVEVQSITGENNCVLIVTDFTCNPLLHPVLLLVKENYQADFEPGTLLRVTLWGEFGKVGNELLAGEVVFLKNLRGKFDRRGNFEAKMEPDVMYPDKVMIQRVDVRHEEAMSLLRLKENMRIRNGPPTTVSVVESAQTMTLQQILNSKAPGRYICKNLKVIGSTPKDLRDFVRAECPACGSSVKASETPQTKCETPNCGITIDLSLPPNPNQVITPQPMDSISQQISNFKGKARVDERVCAPMKFVYMFSLKVSDGTQVVCLVFAGSDAKKFIEMDPVNLYTHPRALQELLNRLSRIWKLEQFVDDTSPEPRFDCGLISFVKEHRTSERKRKPVVRYRAAGTVINWAGSV